MTRKVFFSTLACLVLCGLPAHADATKTKTKSLSLPMTIQTSNDSATCAVNYTLNVTYIDDGHGNATNGDWSNVSTQKCTSNNTGGPYDMTAMQNDQHLQHPAGSNVASISSLCNNPPVPCSSNPSTLTYHCATCTGVWVDVLRWQFYFPATTSVVYDHNFCSLGIGYLDCNASPGMSIP